MFNEFYNYVEMSITNPNDDNRGLMLYLNLMRKSISIDMEEIDFDNILYQFMIIVYYRLYNHKPSEDIDNIFRYLISNSYNLKDI